ncbi:unnamed protein product [Merluccius merluccius]
MVLCVLWCSIAQSILLPMFLWACDRYRADVRMVWEKCVAIMSNDDVDEEGLPCITQHSFLRTMWNVPPTRRFSHDDTDMWISDQIPSYLHHWGSTEDMMVTAAHYSSSLPRPGRRRSSLVSYHEESPRRHPHPHPHPHPHGAHPHHKRRRSSEDSVPPLRHLPRVALCGPAGERYEDEPRCFSRDEVVNFIDETPLPSPRRSPRRRASSAVSLAAPDPRGHTASGGSLLLPHFTLTDFEREPQVLRRLSERKHSGRGGSGGSTPLDGSPGAAGHGSPGPHSGQRHAREDRPQRGGAASPGLGQEGTGHSPRKASRTGQHKGPGADGTGSRNSFVSPPPASSSGCVTFHSDSVGSAT